MQAEREGDTDSDEEDDESPIHKQAQYGIIGEPGENVGDDMGY